ncbi:TraR/DksA family transcriptional regulator [Streptomyces sp. NBC_01497]
MSEAQERLEDGTYGVCTACAQEIDPERLALVPLTHLCVACAASPEPRR